jgi:hypothetical protein
MARQEGFAWHRLIIGGASGFAGAFYFMETGRMLSKHSTEKEPIIPLDVLFDIHPVVGIAFFTAFGLVLGYLSARKGYIFWR